MCVRQLCVHIVRQMGLIALFYLTPYLKLGAMDPPPKQNLVVVIGTA